MNKYHKTTELSSPTDKLGVTHVRVHSIKNPQGVVLPLRDENGEIMYGNRNVFRKGNALTRKAMKANGVVYTKPFAKATERQVSLLAHLANRGGIMPRNKRLAIKRDIENGRSQF